LDVCSVTRRSVWLYENNKISQIYDIQWRRQVDGTGGDTASAEGARRLGGFGGMPPKKIFYL